MKAAFFKRAVILSTAFLICGSPLFAETQTVTVTGALDSHWIYRRNFDLRDGNDTGMSPASLQPSGTGGGVGTINQSEGANYFMSIAQIKVAAGLTDRVTVVMQLVNQRDWNADAFDTSAGGDVAQGAENREEEFDIALGLAYADMKGIFYVPLTLRIGRQDLLFGRGFVLGARYVDPDNSIAAREFTAVRSFDAVRATLDFDPWTLDFVFAQIDENSHDPEGDVDFLFANAHHGFSEYQAVWEGYMLLNRNKLSAAPGIAGTVDQPKTAPDFLANTVGTRVQFDPLTQITMGAEGAIQKGDFYDNFSTPERERDAWALDIFAEYRWDYEWKPALGVEYVALSGDKNQASTEDYEGWGRSAFGEVGPLYPSTVYGDIRNWHGTVYATALGVRPSTTNQEHLSLYGSILPERDFKIEGWFYWFWLEEEVFVDSARSKLSRDVGDELDLHFTYDYTEDVSFVLRLAWFWPGEYFDHAVDGDTPGPTDDDAFQAISGVKVHF